MSAPDLRARWDAFRQQHPDVRIRNAAALLGTTEADLVACDEGQGVTRLQGGWSSLLADLEAIGPVMALTRNDACVSEKTGHYRNVRTFESHRMGLVLDDAIDLRLFYDAWHYGFAVQTPWEGAPDGIRRSFQFFDAHGTAVHKVFLRRTSDVAAFDEIVARYRHAEPGVPLGTTPLPAPAEETPDAELDSAAFLNAWAALRDTHDFFPMLRAHGVRRLQALRLAHGTFAEPVAVESGRLLLEGAAAGEVPIMVFVGSPGCIQIHTGPVRKVKPHGDWFNVLDPDFSLHLNLNLVAQAWVVRKPTVDGPVTSLELYDAAGELVAQFFGKRKNGQAEREDWRALLEQVRAGAPLLEETIRP